jgi:type IV pilus assembly protein PilV
MHRQLSSGFTLIEVLVTLTILTFGLLGIAGLMAKGQRVSFEAYQRQQAVALAADMAERIRSNRTQIPIYAADAAVATPLGDGVKYNDYLTGGTTDCAALTCTLLQLEKYDIALWDGMLNGYSEQQTSGGARIGGIVNAKGCVQELSNTLGTCPPAPAPLGATYTSSLLISVAWQGSDDTVAPLAPCGAGSYGAANPKRRVVTYGLLMPQICP